MGHSPTPSSTPMVSAWLCSGPGYSVTTLARGMCSDHVGQIGSNRPGLLLSQHPLSAPEVKKSVSSLGDQITPYNVSPPPFKALTTLTLGSKLAAREPLEDEHHADGSDECPLQEEVGCGRVSWYT